MADPNSIFAKLLGQGDYLEYPAADGTAIEPGMGLERVDDAGTTKVQPVSTDDSESTLIAREQRNPPRMQDGNPVDQVYDPGDNVETRGFQQHEEARLRLASGTDLINQGAADGSAATVAKHDQLSWNGDGTLVTGGANPQYEALEALDNSGAAAGETALILVKQLE